MASPQLTAMQNLPPEEREAVLRSALADGLVIPDDVRSAFSDIFSNVDSESNPLGGLSAGKTPAIIEGPSLRSDTMEARFTAGANKSEDPAVIAESIGKKIGPENVRVIPENGMIVIRRPDGTEEFLNTPGMDVQDAIDFAGKNYGKAALGIGAAAGGLGIIPAAAMVGAGAALEEAGSASVGDKRTLPERAVNVAAETLLDAGSAGAFRLLGKGAQAARGKVAGLVAGKADPTLVGEGVAGGVALDAIQQAKRPSGRAGWIQRVFPEPFWNQAEKNIGRANEFLDRSMELYGKAPESDTLGQIVRNRIDNVAERITKQGRAVDDANFGLARSIAGGRPVIDDSPARSSFDSVLSEATKNIDSSIVARSDTASGLDDLRGRMFGDKSSGSGLTVEEWQHAKKVLDGAFESNRRSPYFKDQTIGQSGRILKGLRDGLDGALESSAQTARGDAGEALLRALSESRAWRESLDAFHETNLAKLVGGKTDPDEIFRVIQKSSNSRVKNIFAEMDAVPEMADLAGQTRGAMIEDILGSARIEGASSAEGYKVIGRLKNTLSDAKKMDRLSALGMDRSELIGMRRALGAITNRNPVSGSPTALGNMQSIQGLLFGAGAASGVLGISMDSDAAKIAGGLGVAMAGARWAVGKGLSRVLADPAGRGMFVKFLEAAGRKPGSGTSAGRASVEAIKRFGTWATGLPGFELETSDGAGLPSGSAGVSGKIGDLDLANFGVGGKT